MSDFNLKLIYEGRVIAKKKAQNIEDLEPFMKEIKKKFKGGL